MFPWFCDKKKGLNSLQFSGCIPTAKQNVALLVAHYVLTALVSERALEAANFSHIF